MWYHKDTFKNLIFVVLFLIIVSICHTLLPLIGNVLGFVLQIVSPFVLAVILYYLFRPFVDRVRQRVPIYLAISMVYLFLGLVVFLIVFFVYPTIQRQITILQSVNLQNFLNMDLTSIDIFHVKINISEEASKMTSKFLTGLNTLLIGHFSGFVTLLTQLLITLAITPFILYYLLKDDKTAWENFRQLIPLKHSEYFNKLIADVDQVILHFVNGRVIVSIAINTLIFLSFLTIGLDFALILTIISMVFYIIPTFGSFLAMILPLIVGFSMSTFIGIEVLLIMGIAMTLEGFLITPQVMGKKLYMHPLTVILVLLAAGSLYGIFGMLFATPAYAIFKSFVTHTYSLYRQGSINSHETQS